MSKNERKQNTEKRTIKSILLQGTHAILKPTQFNMIKINFDTMVSAVGDAGMDTSDLSIEKYTATTLSKATGETVDTYQVGADRTANSSDTMIKVLEAIKVIVNDEADLLLDDGTALFLGTDGIPRMMSATFTLRTPPGMKRAEHVTEMQQVYYDNGGKLKPGCDAVSLGGRDIPKPPPLPSRKPSPKKDNR